jgi:hypothetical protein
MGVQSIPLACHPTTACAAIRRIEVQVLRPRNAALELRYTILGDIDALLIPPESPSRRADKLWQHTCFEAFVAVGAGYYEFNFSPSTQWAIYRFSAYREGVTAVENASPQIAVRRDAARLTAQAIVDLDVLPGFRDRSDLRLALSAVIEDTQHRMSYWALAHPPGKPDFHHADGFAVKLPVDTGRSPHPNPPPRAGEGKGGGRNRR